MIKDKDIRKKFKRYFEEKQHKWYSSMSLVPPNDPTMLFTTAGMVQFKKQLLGEAGKVTRAASIQKCFRTSDIDEVGRTSRHLTFFEMYGNFSFGDYFKEDAIKWGWGFIVDELKLPVQKLYATVYEEDDEAYNIWKKYLPEEKICRLGEKDNFWKMGATGPCGPCSEIIFDQGPEKGCGKKDCSVGCDCDRYLEVWNLVFTQFDRQSDGTLKDLPKKNIDTGMGLERLDQVVGGKDNVFETPVLKPIMDGVEKDAEDFNMASARIIVDHVRAITFLIGDGVSPSNEGGGYVLRRLIRRASREGRKLGWKKPGLWKHISTVIDIMGEYYPVIKNRANHIASVCKMEEEGFLHTLDSAMRILDGYIEEMNESKECRLSAQKTFKLYDTYGLPVDITKSILVDRGLEVDEKGFNKMMEDRAKSTEWKEKETAGSYWDEIKDIGSTDFAGYEEHTTVSKVIRVLSSKKALVLDKTPMYAESGGQVGDTGKIRGKHGLFKVRNTVKEDSVIVHEGSLEGSIEEGEDVEVNINMKLRKATERNHIATHLLQSVMRDILGKHVQQNGSLVEPLKLRFDFTHTAPLSVEQLNDIENGVNSIIMADMPVTTGIMSKKEAEKKGALAFFGEKYGKEVRTVTVNDSTGKIVSMELCGGTHLKYSGEIGSFKIISENGIAAGVRRIEAITGNAVIEYMQEKDTVINEIAKKLKVPVNKVLEKIERQQQEIKDTTKKISNLENQFLMGIAKSVNSDSMTLKIGGVDFNVFKLPDAKVTALRNYCDNYTKEDKKVAVAISKTDERVTVVVKMSKDLPEEYDARDILQKITSLINGSGGGRKDMAQGGGVTKKDLDTIKREIDQVLIKEYRK